MSDLDDLHKIAAYYVASAFQYLREYHYGVAPEIGTFTTLGQREAP